MMQQVLNKPDACVHDKKWQTQGFEKKGLNIWKPAVKAKLPLKWSRITHVRRNWVGRWTAAVSLDKRKLHIETHWTLQTHADTSLVSSRPVFQCCCTADDVKSSSVFLSVEHSRWTGVHWNQKPPTSTIRIESQTSANSLTLEENPN